MNLKLAELTQSDIRVGKKVFWYWAYPGQLMINSEYIIKEVDIAAGEVTLGRTDPYISGPKGVASFEEFLSEYYCSETVRENYPELFI